MTILEAITAARVAHRNPGRPRPLYVTQAVLDELRVAGKIDENGYLIGVLASPARVAVLPHTIERDTFAS